MKIIRRAARVRFERYAQVFACNDCPGAGYSFACDKQGNLENPSPVALSNYQNCIQGLYPVTFQGMRDESYTVFEPALGVCEFCRAQVELSTDPNLCEGCGAEYNMCGQLLAPREQWDDQPPYTKEFSY